MLRPTPGDTWGVKQHHWNTGAEENQQLNPGGILYSIYYMSILYLDIFSILYSINYMSILYLDIYHCIIYFRYIVLIIIKISI